MATLVNRDVSWIVRRLPKEVARLMKAKGPRLFLAGGFIRSVIAREEVYDVDLFSPDADAAKAAAMELAGMMADHKPRTIETLNATTITGKPSVQFIHRWTFERPEAVVASFDFTIARAVVWFENGGWMSHCDESFYADLAAKRLVYCSPERHEDAGGSLLRVLKFYQRGYRIPLESLAALLARMVYQMEPTTAAILAALREVDPMPQPEQAAVVPEPVEETTDGE